MTASLSLRRALANHRACNHALPKLHRRAPQTPHEQRPPSKLPTALRKSKARPRAASVPRGDWSLQ
ncbi:hypothetical protein BGY98DRAFT_1049940 [Russula aff. rugulosa BPL654]|nr:hypothetical protein BGY98DRAFT_1049940 [Russula aff. rugulosa BPL654]